MTYKKKIFTVCLMVLLCMNLFKIQSNAATKTTLNKTKATLKIGTVTTLKVSTGVKPSKVKWSTSNKKIVSIKSNGKKVILTGNKAGKATITCKIGNKKKTCKVTVKSANTSYTQKEVVSGLKSAMSEAGFQWYPDSSEYAQFPEAGPSGGMGWGEVPVAPGELEEAKQGIVASSQFGCYTYFYIEYVRTDGNNIVVRLYRG